MEVKLNREGMLVIFAENDLESYALQKWFMEFEEDQSRVAFGVDTDGWKKVNGRMKTPKEEY